MYARWASFEIGMWLLLAPLVLGYAEFGAVLHDVALGLLVCIATLAALEWPPFRFAMALPAAWLLFAGRAAGGAAGVTEIACGVALLVLVAIPSGRRLPRPAEPGRARA